MTGAFTVVVWKCSRITKLKKIYGDIARQLCTTRFGFAWFEYGQVVIVYLQKYMPVLKCGFTSLLIILLYLIADVHTQMHNNTSRWLVL